MCDRKDRRRSSQPLHNFDPATVPSSVLSPIQAALFHITLCSPPRPGTRRTRHTPLRLPTAPADSCSVRCSLADTDCWCMHSRIGLTPQPWMSSLARSTPCGWLPNTSNAFADADGRRGPSVKEGDRAPAFSVPADDGTTVTLDSLHG